MKQEMKLLINPKKISSNLLTSTWLFDEITNSCEPSRFKALKEYVINVGFLYKLLNISRMHDVELMKHCQDLHLTLTNDGMISKA